MLNATTSCPCYALAVVDAVTVLGVSVHTPRGASYHTSVQRAVVNDELVSDNLLCAEVAARYCSSPRTPRAAASTRVLLLAPASLLLSAGWPAEFSP